MCWTCDKEAPTKPCRGCDANLPLSFDRCPRCYCPTKFLKQICARCNQEIRPGESHVANPGYFPKKNIKCFVLINLGDLVTIGK